ncbi:MAG: DNA topoisomerase IV [Paludibacter sp.]|nr:MAG: DNA topoisomerase IV [Paludibacter sp.]
MNNQNNIQEYKDDHIITLEGLEHIRRRPGMYIGKLGDGKNTDDGIYVLLKEVIDNSIDEFREGNGKKIEITLTDSTIKVRDYGRGIPLNSAVKAVSVMNTGGKFDSQVFKKSVGLNGVGTKAVNALSEYFVVESFRENKSKRAVFEKGKLVSEEDLTHEKVANGTEITFLPDKELFTNFAYKEEYIEDMLRNYSYLNEGLTLTFNEKAFYSENGLIDLLNEKMTSNSLYPIIHFKTKDIEIAITHTDQYGEEYYSFVNGQYTTQGGTHQSAFREISARIIREFYNKNMEFSDIRNGIVAAVAIGVEEPVFESQTKIKLGSKYVDKDETTTVNKFISDFLSKELDNYLHKEGETAEAMLQKILASEKERKAMAGVSKIARERAKKVSLHNKKLRDCRIHFNDNLTKNEDKNEAIRESTIFITEGDSASGSITKSRNVNTQAVFSLRGKPLNSYGMNKEVVYKNEEFNLLQAALNIEDGLDGLRYNKVVVATDADVDGMHIRLLLISFFLQFFPDLIKKGHVYILQTPLFRVRNKKETIYCYSEEERINAIKKIGKNAEITRFKGLGEISPDEFKNFIGKDMRLERVSLRKEDAVNELLLFYMGKNTSERQEFIIDNLVVEEDIV